MEWFLIHTKPRQEVIALENLERQDYPCYLPMLPTEKLRQGKLITLQEPLFPRYLFIQLGQGTTSQSWSPIRSTRGVSRLVSFGNEPARVPTDLVELLRSNDAEWPQEVRALFKSGDRVKILEGPFVGLDAIYQMKVGENRVMVLIELMSKSTRLMLQVNQLQKAQ